MEHVCIIAEAGVNHNGDYQLALKMVDEAKRAGADYIKFQTFIPEKIVSRCAPKADYQKENTDTNESQLEMLKRLALSKEDFLKINRYCRQKKIGFISTAFDIESISFLKTFHMDFWKIPSGELTNLPYLETIAKTKKKVIMSTGMCDLDEIKRAVKVVEDNGTKEIILLHCNTQYPTPYEHVNLRAMNTIQTEIGRLVGYSDHTLGIEVPIAAVAMGAVVIEKHFTLSRNMEGPDHKASLEPKELKKMVSAIRNIEQAMGTGIKEPSLSEIENRSIARKSIVAQKPIKAGELLTAENLTTKRPGNGISPMQWYEVIGLKAIKDFQEDDLIEV